jgi:hypothetical protein
MKSNPFPVQLKLVKNLDGQEVAEQRASLAQAYPDSPKTRRRSLPDSAVAAAVLPGVKEAVPLGVKTAKARFFSSTIHPSGEDSLEKFLPAVIAAARLAPTIIRAAPAIIRAGAKLAGSGGKFVAGTAAGAAGNAAADAATGKVAPAAPQAPVPLEDLGTGEKPLDIALNPALSAGPKTRTGTSLPSPRM